jgi:hypothetical protein
MVRGNDEEGNDETTLPIRRFGYNRQIATQQITTLARRFQPFVHIRETHS